MCTHRATKRTPLAASTVVTLLLAGLSQTIIPTQTPAHGAYAFYTDQTAFLAAASLAGSPASVETYEELAPLAVYPAPVTLGGVTYGGFGTRPSSWEVVSSAQLPVESGKNAFMFIPGSSPIKGALSFGGGSVSSFGFAICALTSANKSRPFTYQIDVIESDGTQHNYLENFTSPGTAYFGFVESPGGSPGISEIAILGLSEGLPPIIDDVGHSTIVDGSFVAIDPMVIPEPASWMMLAAGLMVIMVLIFMKGNLLWTKRPEIYPPSRPFVAPNVARP